MVENRDLGIPVFYKYKVNESCYKVQIYTDIDNSKVDEILDCIYDEEYEFITEEEFNKLTPETMDIAIMDTTESIEIGILTTKYLDMDEAEEDTNLQDLM